MNIHTHNRNGRNPIWMMVLAMILTLLPGMAFASEANVVLKFSQQDQVYLLISLAFGVLAIIVGWFLAKSVKAMSPGDESMQSVGRAIKDGALAYLTQQVKMMIPFVIILAALLLFLYGQQYGDMMKGVWTSVSFMAGVAASYIAGYTGMLLAVEGNMRTANAALSSYSKALQVAFRSGAVAGLITVGMGLIGATLIIVLGGADAMKFLVGFGFGGSLAALFMRVGGGIFTKAADVGADLVGKVEAGIPEDDPRNPAVIADNVGDNVGDCAGMAADVFESYEVTLVAAIVLGAATSVIFDQTTWMKLVMFALMARGIGILASIIGIFSVKGSDDINKDPLMFIRRGFMSSAAIAAVLTAGLAYYLMGGMGAPIKTTQFVTGESFMQQDLKKAREARDLYVAQLSKEEKKEVPMWRVTGNDLQMHWLASSVRDEIAKEKKVAAATVATADIVKAKRFADAAKAQNIPDAELTKIVDRAKAMNFPALSLDDTMAASTFNMAIQEEQPNAPKPREYSGYSALDWKEKDSILSKYAVVPAAANPTGETPPKSFLEEHTIDGKGAEMKKYEVFKLRVEAKPQPNQPAQPARELFFGPSLESTLNEQIKGAEQFATITKLDRYPVKLYANAEGDLLLGVDSKGTEKGTTLDNPSKLLGGLPFSYFKVTKTELEALNKEKAANPTKQMGNPPAQTIPVAVVQGATVEWWRFFIAIFFGILMAFAIELLTDYYVSTHKKPVQEVAGVSSAGPAPMIINGFALAQESSVFSVLAIVVALIVPLQLFPHEQFGGYILSFYGIALVGLGLLTTTGYILAMDTFGPISDNAQGVFEMSGAGHNNEEGSKRVQRLDAAGNTTKALTKGFAIATAVVAAVALFHSYIEEAKLAGIGLPLDVPAIFLGLLIGGAAPYLFSAFSINAVGRAAFELINEVRKQFRNDPGIMAGTSKPNYASCVAIVTAAAQKELIGPGILAIGLPLAVGFGFNIGAPQVRVGDGTYVLQGAQALGGFLAGAILSGQLLAVMLANAGGIWDNAKKVIEDGMHGGKGSEAHKAGVVCDTVGDPFKDTAGPALNPLIKVMNLVALLLAPVVIRPMGDGITIGVTLVCLAALAFSTWWSKRSSMTTAMAEAQGEIDAIAAADATPKKRITVEDEPEKTE